MSGFIYGIHLFIIYFKFVYGLPVDDELEINNDEGMASCDGKISVESSEHLNIIKAQSKLLEDLI
jgi:hypothetical protein